MASDTVYKLDNMHTAPYPRKDDRNDAKTILIITSYPIWI
jgi:hypothetical protein